MSTFNIPLPIEVCFQKIKNPQGELMDLARRSADLRSHFKVDAAMVVVEQKHP
jgi:hypothetical protein